jgi:hypothetical protein
MAKAQDISERLSNQAHFYLGQKLHATERKSQIKTPFNIVGNIVQFLRDHLYLFNSHCYSPLLTVIAHPIQP